MRLVALVERLTDILGFIGAVMVLPLIAIMVFEVFSRYVFNAPTIWAFELSYMLMAAIFACGFAYALKHRQHVNVDFIYGRLGARPRAFINLIGYAMFFPAVCWLTYALFHYAVRAFRSGEVSGVSAWNPVVWPIRAILFVGFTVFAIQIAVEIVKCVRAAIVNDGRDL